MCSKDEIVNILSKIKYLFIDFTALINMDSEEDLNLFFDLVIEKSIDVSVSRNFYENIEIVMNCASQKQVHIASLSKQFFEMARINNKLRYFSNVTSPSDVVGNLKSRSNVAFMFHCYSEFGEALTANQSNYSAKAIIVNKDGKLDFCETYDEAVNVIHRDVDPIALENSYFSVSFTPDVGQQVKTKDGTVIKLTNFIGRGGEGAVYDCDYKTNYVVKIYNKGQLNKLRLKKLSLMEKTQVRYDGICWPEKVIYSPKGEPIGYLMQKINGKNIASIFEGCSSVQKEFPNFTKIDLIDISINILKKIQYLHIFGIVLGDVRLKNIVIDKNGNICLVDIDSCQIGSLPCPIGFPDFTPPELQHIEFKNVLRSYYNESFSCSVLMFKILFCGLHPYDQRNGADTLEEEIERKTFPYPINYTAGFDKIPSLGNYSYLELWLQTPYQIQKMFFDIFRCGERFTLTELILYLKTYREFIINNKNNLKDINRIFFENK